MEITNIENKINLQNEKIKKLNETLIPLNEELHSLKDELFLAEFKEKLKHMKLSKSSVNFMKTFTKIETKSKVKNLILIGNHNYEDYGKYNIKLYTKENIVFYLSFVRYYYHDDGYRYALKLWYDNKNISFTYAFRIYRDEIHKDNLNNFVSKLNLNKEEFLKILKKLYEIFEKVFKEDIVKGHLDEFLEPLEEDEETLEQSKEPLEQSEENE